MASSGEPSGGRKRKRSQGHHYGRVNIKDSAKAHLGDTYHFGVDDPLRRLPYAEDAPFNSYTNRHHPDCLLNTRVNLLGDIYRWANSTDSSGVFWLSGLAGTGKSTIARTVAHEYDQGQRLAASFFFTRGGRDVGNTSMFITTIAVQLARNVPAIRKYINDAVGQRDDIVSLSLRHQWDHLILGPLSKVSDSGCLTSLVLVVDALDECDSHDDIRLIVRLLAELQSKKGVCLRVLLTSRPVAPIRCEFAQVPDAEHQDFVLHKISRFIVDDDISRYLEYNLGKFAGDRSLGAGWPGADIVRQLVQKASGLFIWAATAFRFIEQGRQLAPKRLHKLLCDKNTTSAAPEKHLNDIYIMVLINSVQDFDDEEKEGQCAVIKDVLGCIVLLFSPLSSQSLDRLLDGAEGVRPTLHDLHAILDIPDDQTQPLRLHHPSFRDFLLSKDRCGDAFWIDDKRAHEKLAHCCLKLMSAPDSLRQDICNLSRPGVLRKDIKEDIVTQNLPPELQYACRYWVDHLERSERRIEDGDATHLFLNTYLLHWLEAMSLLNETGLCVRLVVKLQEMARPSSNIVGSFLHDISRFVSRFAHVIAEAPLQIYSSALLFSPESSLVKSMFFRKVPQVAELLLGRDKEWDARRSVLDGHRSLIRAVVFSYDGKLLASASNDTTVRVWETTTAMCKYMLKGHLKAVQSVAFSEDGNLLVSASEDGTARVWETATGNCCSVLKVCTKSTRVIVLSSKGELLASTSEGRRVRVWDMSTGNCCSELKGYTKRVSVMAFSAKKELLAVAYKNMKLRIWETATGKCLSKLKGHSCSIWALAFSVDGQLLASASADRTVRMWSIAAGSCYFVLKHTSIVHALAFSYNSELFASADENMVRIWDVATRTCLHKLKSYSNREFALGFSVDGQLIASASVGVVTLWEIKTAIRIRQHKMESHANNARMMTFSADGKLLTTVSGKTIRIWETRTGTCHKKLKGYRGTVTALAFSADGTLLAYGSYGGTVRVYDTTTNKNNHLYDPQRHEDKVSAVAFSGEGNLLASGSIDEKILVWKVAVTSTKSLYNSGGYSDDIGASNFSPYRKLFASEAGDARARTWKTSKSVDDCCAKWERNPTTISILAFSTDGGLLASASNGGKVRVWDVEARETLIVFDFRALRIRQLSFSPDTGTLHTNRGDFLLASNLCLTRPGKLQKLERLFQSGSWIICKEQRILRLPAEYSVVGRKVYQDIVDLECKPGHRTLLKFRNLI